MKILMIQRAELFSPNAVENDRAILEAVALRLSSRGHLVTQVDETLLASSLAADKPDFIFSMARLPASLRLLEASGLRVINAPQGVSQCSRRQVQSLMDSLCIPYPAGSGPHGYWLKRADFAAQTTDDVVYVPDLQALASAEAAMRARGIRDYLVCPHGSDRNNLTDRRTTIRFQPPTCRQRQRHWLQRLDCRSMAAT